MIIFRYLLKEVAKTQLAVFFILMTIFISQKFVSILDDASEGSIPGHLVMVFIGLKIPDIAGLMLPLSFFLGVLLAYSRIYADSEMTVFHACGVSEWYVVRVTLLLGLITALLTALFTLYLGPTASEYEYTVKEQLSADSGLSSIIAGRFQNTGNGKAVVFVKQKNRKDNALERVFVAQVPDDNSTDKNIINASLVYAEKGLVIEDEAGGQKLIMENGTRYQSDADNGEFRSVSFDKYYIEIQDQKVEHRRRKLSAISTMELLKHDGNQYSAAIQWRISFPIACLILTLIAVPLSRVNPRQGKFAKMLPALLLFLSYFLLLTAVRSSIESGKLPSAIGVWPIHILAFMLGTSLLMQNRVSGKKLQAKLPKFPWRKRG